MPNIIGILKNHFRYCSSEKCKCKNLGFDNEELPLMNNMEITDKNKILENEYQKNHKDIKVMICEIINTTLKNMSHHENSALLEIVQAYINFTMTMKTHNSLYNLMLAEDYNPSFFQEFQSFCIRRYIEMKMASNEKRNNLAFNENFVKVISFHKSYMILNDLIYNTIALYCLYWYEYLKNRPGIFYLIL